MRRRSSNFNITLVFADGSTMSEESILKNGKVIRAEDNVDIELEMRRVFHPEYAEEARKIAKFERIEKRRKELMAELESL